MKQIKVSVFHDLIIYIVVQPLFFEFLIITNHFQKLVPFLVIATSGTTVMGAYDPLNPIADLCKEHDLWLHVDVGFKFLISTQPNNNL